MLGVNAGNGLTFAFETRVWVVLVLLNWLASVR